MNNKIITFLLAILLFYMNVLIKQKNKRIKTLETNTEYLEKNLEKSLLIIGKRQQQRDSLLIQKHSMQLQIDSLFQQLQISNFFLDVHRSALEEETYKL